MKTNILMIIALYLAFGCGQGNKNTEEKTQDTINLSDTLSYKTESFFKTEKDCNKDTCDAYVAAKYPVFANNELNNFVLQVITPAPFKDHPTSSLAIAADSFINEFIDYKNEFPDNPMGYHWDQSLTVEYQNKEVISFMHKTYAYTGGAHGMQPIIYYNLNKANLTKIKLEDILVDDYQAELTKIAEEIFRKNEGLKPQENLEAYFFEDQKFILNDNFLITADGLLFLYNQYEIKAYAYGTTELLIPYSKIKHLIANNGVLKSFI